MCRSPNHSISPSKLHNTDGMNGKRLAVVLPSTAFTNAILPHILLIHVMIKEVVAVTAALWVAIISIELLHRLVGY